MLYELREADFHEIRRSNDVKKSVLEADHDHDSNATIDGGHDQLLKNGYTYDQDPNTGDDQDSEGRNRWE